jgi:long-chain acyl-CoA synthetase
MSTIFAPIADERGDEAALIDEFGETSWSDFDLRVNRLVHALRDAGVRSGDAFAVLSGNRREYFEVMAAATHSGTRFVPVNWHFHAEEVAYVLDDSDSKALLVGARFSQLAAEATARRDAPKLGLKAVMGLHGEPAPAGFVDYEDVLASASDAEPDDQQAGGPMFYTSGTTGRPKGVVSSTFSGALPVQVMPMVGKSIATTLGLPDGGLTYLNGPVYHSAQWAFSFLPMLGGIAVLMRHKFDPEEALELIDRHGVTNTHLVPTQFVRLLRASDARKAAFRGDTLEVVWHGAAPCSPAVKRQMIDWWGPKISEYYGSTEGAIVSTISAEEWLAHPGSLGRAVDNMEIMVIRDDGSPADTGEPGQLYFRNRMGSDFEYHNDPEKTAAAHREPGVFTVGDVGYVDVEGYLFLSDRKIDMIISGGVNIYPAEIEGVLVSHPQVADAAVFGVPNDEFGEEVKAAVELIAGVEPSAELERALREHCREHLAGYKVPRSVDFESALPRHETGKLYKRLLRDAYWAGRERAI